MKYFDWRIDDNKTVKNLLWLREKDDGTISVTREYDGVWQWDKEYWAWRKPSETLRGSAGEIGRDVRAVRRQG